MKHSSKTKNIAKRIDFFLNKLEHKKSHKKSVCDLEQGRRSPTHPNPRSYIYTNNIINNNIITNNDRLNQIFNIFDCQRCCFGTPPDFNCTFNGQQGVNIFLENFNYLTFTSENSPLGLVDVNKFLADTVVNRLYTDQSGVGFYIFNKIEKQNVDGQDYLTGIFLYFNTQLNSKCNLYWFWNPITLTNNGLYNMNVLQYNIKYITCIDSSGICNLNNQIAYLLYLLLSFSNFYTLDIASQNILFNNINNLNTLINKQYIIYPLQLISTLNVQLNNATQTINSDGSQTVMFNITAPTPNGSTQCTFSLNVSIASNGVITSITSV